MNFGKNQNQQLQPLPQGTTIAEVAPIEFPEGGVVFGLESLDRLVEPAALPACRDLFNKNIRTISASANSKDEERAYIDIDLTTLSEQNHAAALSLGAPVRTAGPNQEPVESGVIKLAVPIHKTDTVDAVAARLSEITANFTPQPLLWAPKYTIAEIKALHRYDEGETVNPEDFVNEGWYYDDDTGLFHLSEELFRKSKEATVT